MLFISMIHISYFLFFQIEVKLSPPSLTSYVLQGLEENTTYSIKGKYKLILKPIGIFPFEPEWCKAVNVRTPLYVGKLKNLLCHLGLYFKPGLKLALFLLQCTIVISAIFVHY